MFETKIETWVRPETGTQRFIPHLDEDCIAKIRGAVYLEIQKLHDESYPTPWAYEKACEALEKHRARANRLHTVLDDFDRYASTDPDYIGSPFQAEVQAALAETKEGA